MQSGAEDRTTKAEGTPRNQLEAAGEQAAYIPPAILFGWFARYFLIGNMLLVWIGRWFMYGLWPGTLKLWLCTAMGIASMIWAVAAWPYTARWRRTITRVKPAPVRVFIPATYAVGLVGMILAEAIFMTSVVWGPPQVGG